MSHPYKSGPMAAVELQVAATDHHSHPPAVANMAAIGTDVGRDATSTNTSSVGVKKRATVLIASRGSDVPTVAPSTLRCRTTVTYTATTPTAQTRLRPSSTPWRRSTAGYCPNSHGRCPVAASRSETALVGVRPPTSATSDGARDHLISGGRPRGLPGTLSGVRRWLLAAGLAVLSSLVAACSDDSEAAQGTVEGVLIMRGGPLGAPAVLVAGEVELRSEDGVVYRVAADGAGRFSVEVVPGTYAVTGSSPAFRAQRPCESATRVPVSDGEVAVVEVECRMR